ncbi:type VII secretion AAA-ATPase EccA (plasmid) [Mycobacterium gallinarum]|uniref:Type VII secretion AAA-ATPase EccA n=1 Tax=Mycobacterium gallinarum TaxID=39689 RepID=A0A9W4B9M8_9MYCO|nr:AAA family ATPase [Mycobacterium gallinarum]BBY96375.1 type VII secretion AAA-ATPase EccA [Mycobacterium gallinarum]
MSTARDYLDAGFEALGLLGSPADSTAARERFRRAVSMDPGMCDAWLGLIATGDHYSETLRHAHETSATVHRETRRLGLQDTALEASVPSPGFIEVFPYTAASITLAYIAALLTEKDYDTAEKLLESYDTSREPLQTPIWRCLGATLHYVTQRWTDVLDWAARPVTGTLRVVDAATDLMAGIAHVGLGEFDAGLVLLKGVPTDQVSPYAGAFAALYRGYALRWLGRENDARVELGKASVGGRMLPDASTALADPTYAPPVTTAEAIAARTSRWDPQSGPTTEELRQAEQAHAAEAVLEEAERDLQSFIGLGTVKAHVNKLKNVQIYDRAMAARGEGVGQRNALHMTLVGPPGTAKTSIARVMGKMYFGLGILDSPECIEVSRKDLVGGVIGDTEAKTGAMLTSARGKVLFVDEAYTLYQADNERDFGRIALDIIMKFAEDHRDDTMIALAGYADGMNRLLSANPGLRSRFPTQLEFSSYSADELGQIAAMFAQNYRVLVHPEAIDIFGRYTSWLTATPTNNPENPAETLIDIAGNGRYVRNVMSEAVEKMKARVVSDPSIDLATADSDLLRTVVGADMTDALREVLVSAGIQTREQG